MHHEETNDHDDRNIGEAYAALFATFRTALSALNEVLGEVRQTEEAIGCRGGPAFPGPKPALLGESAAAILRALTSHARYLFAPAGTPIPIDNLELTRRFLPDKDAADTFDPIAAWRWLEATYGGEKGFKAASTIAAMTLRATFRTSLSAPMRLARGAVLLSMPVAIDAYGYLSRKSAEAVDEVGDALATFMSWCDVGEDGRLRHELHDIACCTVRTRRRAPITPGIDVITYRSRLDFALSPALAEKLHLFLEHPS